MRGKGRPGTQAAVGGFPCRVKADVALPQRLGLDRDLLYSHTKIALLAMLS